MYFLPIYSVNFDKVTLLMSTKQTGKLITYFFTVLRMNELHFGYQKKRKFKEKLCLFLDNYARTGGSTYFFHFSILILNIRKKIVIIEPKNDKFWYFWSKYLKQASYCTRDTGSRVIAFITILKKTFHPKDAF